MVRRMPPDAVEALWQRFQPLVAQRVQAVQDHLDGRGDRETARAAAHALAGALGSYGRAEGSVAARELEAMLASDHPLPDAAGEARETLRRLRSSL